MIVSAMCHQVNEEGATLLILLIHNKTTLLLFPWRIKGIKAEIGGRGASVRSLVKYLTEAPKRFSGTSGSICHAALFGVIKSMFFFFFACIFTTNIFPPH